MSSSNIQPSKRGRPPKVQKLISDILKTKSEPCTKQTNIVNNEEETVITRRSSLRIPKNELIRQNAVGPFKVENVAPKNVSKSDSVVDALKSELFSEIDLIQEKVNLSLKNKEMDIDNLGSKNKDLLQNSNLLSGKNKELQVKIVDLEEAFAVSLKTIETEKMNAISYNKSLAMRIKTIASETGKECAKLSSENEMLNKRLAEKEEKYSKLTELIEPLRKKVKEQENLRAQLNQANGEIKSLHVVNEEIRKELSASQNHQEALDVKEKELDISRRKTDNFLENAKKDIDEEKFRIRKDKKELEELKKKFEEDKKKVQEDQRRLSCDSKALEELELKLDEEKQLITEDQEAIKEDKIVLDNEWGDIMKKKHEFEQLSNSPDSGSKEDIKEKQEQLNEMVFEKNTLQAKIDTNEVKFKDLFLKHNLLEDTHNVTKEGYKGTIAELKAKYMEVNLSKKALDEDLKCKSITVVSLKEELISSKKNLYIATKNLEIRTKQADGLKKSDLESGKKIQDLENRIGAYKSNQEKVFKTIMRQKEEEIYVLKHQIGELISSKKRKQVEDEYGVSKKIKSSKDKNETPAKDVRELSDIIEENEHEPENAEESSSTVLFNSYVVDSSPRISNIVPEVVNEYDIPSDEEIGVEEDISTDENAAASTMTSSDTNDSSALKLMNDFESFLKNSRSKTQQKVKELTKPVVDEVKLKDDNIEVPSYLSEQSLEKNSERAGKLYDLLHQTDLISSKETVLIDKKIKSVRDIFDDSDESEGEESDLSQPTTSKEGNKTTEVEPCRTEVQRSIVIVTSVPPLIPEPTSFPPLMPEPTSVPPLIPEPTGVPPLMPEPTNCSLPTVSNSPARTSSRPRPVKPMITVRDINTLSSFLGQSRDLLEDVIVPNLSNTDNAPMEISDDDAKERENETKTIEKDLHNLKFQVAGVVKNCLNKFYKTFVYAIQSRQDFEDLAVEFSKQFREDIMSTYKLSHSSLAGIFMSSEDRTSIIDQIIFHFQVKKTVNEHLSKYFPSNSAQMIAYLSKYTNQLSSEIRESYRMMKNSLVGIELTPDNDLWIRDKIDFNFSSSNN